MTATVFAPTGNPVRRFVAALAAVGVAASMLWFSGLAAPRLAVVSAEPTGGGALRGTLIVRLRNDGPLPVEVRAAGFRNDRLSVSAVRPAGIDLPGGEVAILEVDYVVDCGSGPAPEQDRLIVTVATQLRIERTIDVSGTSLLQRVCPAR